MTVTKNFLVSYAKLFNFFKERVKRLQLRYLKISRFSTFIYEVLIGYSYGVNLLLHMNRKMRHDFNFMNDKFTLHSVIS